MNNSRRSGAETVPLAAGASKRVILSMGGKGGVGKTSVMAGLAEWFDTNQIPVKLLDLDTENKARGSLTHFFGGRVPKVNIHTPAGLDAFVDHLADGSPVILADMGAGSGQITYDWFDKMYPDVTDAGIVFTTIGVVTSDPASVESVLAWAARLQNRVAYLIVENSIAEHADFTYWRESDQARQFCEAFAPARQIPSPTEECRPRCFGWNNPVPRPGCSIRSNAVGTLPLAKEFAWPARMPRME